MYDYLYPDRLRVDDPNVTLKMTARLRAGGIVLLAADALRATTSMTVPFLKTQARLSSGVLELARLTGSPVLACDPLYDDDGGVRIQFLPPLNLAPAATREAFIERNMPALVAAFESFVAACPEQWMRWADL